MATVVATRVVERFRRASLSTAVVLPTLLLVVVAVLTVTPVVTALLAGFRDAPPGRPGTISWDSIRASLDVMAQPLDLVGAEFPKQRKIIERQHR